MSDETDRLWREVKKGNAAKVISALEDGADANAPDKLSRTPLMEAAKRGNEAVVSLLLEHGADINAQDGRGASPLIHALAPRNTKVIALLLKEGASAAMADKSGDMPSKLLKQNQMIFFLSALFSILLFVWTQLKSTKDKDLQRSEVIVMLARLYDVFVTFKKYEGITELLQKAARNDH